MDRILHDANNAQRILKLTADTMLLVDRHGVCVDIEPHCDLWFLQENILLGKNIFELLPEYTKERVMPIFQTVLEEQRSISKNFKLVLKDEIFYFKCLMFPYDGMVLCQYRDITQRSNVKRRLEQANLTLRAIQKIAQIGQWAYNTNQNIFHYLGYTGVLCEESVQNLAIEKYVELIVEEDRQSFIEWCHVNEKELNMESISYRVRLNGEIFYMRIQTYLREERPDGSFNIEGYIQNITDIQHRRNDINTLTHAINNAKESIFAARPDGTIIFANRRFLYNHGISENEDISQLKIYNVAADMPTQEAWNERCKDVIHGGSSNFVAHHPSKINRDILAYEGTMYNVTNDSGEESYWSFAHDISERIRYEAQIKRLNQIMDTTINNLPAGIVVKEINNDFRYIYRNREAYNRDLYKNDPVGKNDFDFYPPIVAEKKRQEDIQVATSGKGMHWTVEGKDRNGNLIILDKRKIRVDGDELSSPIIVTIEWDVTELEMMKRELLSAKEKAEMSDSLKSAFLANMSHEIRTPLNAIVGFSELMVYSEDPAEKEEYMSIIQSNNELLLRLINDILDLSKIESGILERKRETFNLAKVCNELYTMIQPKITNPDVEFQMDNSGPDCWIFLDRSRLKQVWMNYLTNAVKCTKSGYIKMGYSIEREGIRIYVEDSGVGIPEELQERVFGRFQKLNEFAQGTGLGLAISRAIIEGAGGEVGFTSTPGIGSTFWAWIPCEISTQKEHNPTISLPLQHQLSLNEIDKKELKILIAEDNESNYSLVQHILKSYHLTHVQNGAEAVNKVREEEFDLVLMDMKMPVMGGLEATRKIREFNNRIPIIALTANAFDADRISALDAGCNEFLAKPLKKSQLLELFSKKW